MKRIAPAAAIFGVIVFAACDIPTSLPIVEQRWILPGESTALAVDQLLPSGVSESEAGFQVDVPPVTVEQTLGTLCPLCATYDGATVPKPAFEDTVRAVTNLPADVESAALASARVDVTIHNGFGFDPLRPGGSERGTLRIRVRAVAGGAILGEITLDGTSESLPPGATVTRRLTLGAGTLGQSFRTTVAVSSPQGDPVTLDAAQKLTVTATPRAVLVTATTVQVDGQEVSLDLVELDVKDLEATITDQIREGNIVLDVANPFGVAFDGQLEIHYPGGTLSRPLHLPESAASTVTLSYSGDELRAFLGQENVTLAGTGTVSSGAGAITVTPGQHATIDARLDLVLEIGG